MKKQFLLMAIIAMLIGGCKPNEPEETPTALFSFAQNELKVTFTNSSKNARSYVWTFGDGATSKEKNPVHTYAKAGTYNVQLTAKNITKSDTYSQNVTISLTDLTPTAKFTYSKNGLTVTFINSSTNAQSYKWEFGDGPTSTETNPSHTYTNYGTYSVKLTAINGSKTNSYTQSLTLTEVTPTASYTYKTEHPLKAVFTNTSKNATSYVWDFGDGTTSTEKNPTHRYSGKGVYKVTLKATSGSKSNTYATNITIVEPTKCYLSGYVISKIPKQNEYYQIRFTDQYIYDPDEFGTTPWTLLSNANLPKTFTFTSPKQITGFTKYWCTLWQSSKSDGSNATNAFRCNVTKEQLYTSFPEKLTNNDQTKTIIEIHFIWK